LLPFTPDYRWMFDREDSPWYPTARLFRQTEARDWPNVVDRLRTGLGAVIEDWKRKFGADLPAKGLGEAK
jgi:hypothetical protein